MQRGFGIDATVPVDVAVEIARLAEAAGFASFWVNGSPPREALEILAAVAREVDLPLGTGVLPLQRRPMTDVVADIKELEVPVDRLMLGLGYAAPQGALETIRDAVRQTRAIGATPIVGAFGPNMTKLAGEISDGVLFTWWFRAAVEESRPLVEEGATRADRETPPIMSYIRCALLPQAEEKLADQAASYDSSPRYRELFRRHGLTARDTVITGATRGDFLPGIDHEEGVLDVSVIRAITGEPTVEAHAELIEATRP